MKLIFLAALLTLLFEASGQQCAVSVSAIAGKYEGECKEGKANGYGKATGEDHYEGVFKNGYPDGEGTYVWKDGRIYTGQWLKGVQNGSGLLLMKKEDRPDTLMKGFWKNGKYIGKYANPFVVHARTKQITGLAIRRINNTVAEINLTLESASGNEVNGFNSSLSLVEKPSISSMQLLSGEFAKRTVDEQLLKKTAYRFEGVTFPFRTIVNVGAEMFEIEIYEAGNWLVEVKIAN